MATYPFDQPTHDQTAWEQQPETPPAPSVAAAGPAIDVIENQEELWVYIDLPGYQTEEISIRGDESTLMLSAERPRDLEEDRTVLVQERPVHTERTIQLPTPVDIANASMKYEDGVCRIELPKAGTARFTELEFSRD